MPAGDRLTAGQRNAVEEAIRKAELLSRAEFSVYVGPVTGPDPRAYATQLHNTLVAPTRSIMIVVDPDRRIIEIITGAWVRRTLSDTETALAAETMRSSFAEDDLVGGLRAGIALLADHARN
ncbi:TLP18.3, Psb32 and MOLO-1 founding protein of phosphatase [Nocardioides terrae]|uniref:TLP18.3, Psb32 and MOLO-1 founding protein of phosphatase n=1 Tax=Nocardioides terrae TaxID=574651 RepID=A0A1I1DUF9_9ACTN|nr:DUF5130 family protein [Nocardioides terrae]SFB76340.1 TLP18.3, Psb32 and MOLO-1 founding protein of phosphatase [Nocardioides terrae]